MGSSIVCGGTWISRKAVWLDLSLLLVDAHQPVLVDGTEVKFDRPTYR